MNQCRECGKGYCPNRARRVFGHLPPNYCSPQCFTKSRVGLAKFQKEQVREKYDAKKLSLEIFEALYLEGLIDDIVMANEELVEAAVERVEALIKKLEKRGM